MKRQSTGTTKQRTSITESKLRSVIRSILVEVKSDAEMQKAIEEYQSMMEEIDSLTASISETLNSIKTKDKDAKAIFKKMEKFMETKVTENFESARVTTDKWVATLQREAKYKRIAPDYKEVYEEALTKLNAQTRAVVEAITEANVKAKEAATVDNLYIKAIGESKKSRLTEANPLTAVLNKLKSWQTKFTALVQRVFTNITKFEKIAERLPPIKK